MRSLASHRVSAFRRFARITTMATVVLLVPAVPASALTFLTPWTVKQSRSRGAPVAVVVADAFPSVGSLSIDMGATASRSARLSVTATRTFRVGAGGETVAIRRAFETLLRDASLSVSISLSPSKGFRIPTLTLRARTIAQLFTSDREYSKLLPAGDYKVTIKVAYANRRGTWDNSFPAPGSPHAFSIRSL